MKLRIIFALALMFCAARISTVIANDNSSFTENLKNCSEYYGSQTIELNDIKLTTTKQIHGLKGEKCSYQETIATKDSRYSVNCMLSKDNIKELVQIMEDFEKNADAKNIDLNDFTQVESTSVVAGWTKYLQNPEICSIEIE